jgi:hypothetical protein
MRAAVISINAHYDGRVIVPDEPVDLRPNEALIVRIEPKRSNEGPVEESALSWLAENAVGDTGLPTDLSYEHDHYLYGTPKKDT